MVLGFDMMDDCIASLASLLLTSFNSPTQKQFGKLHCLGNWQSLILLHRPFTVVPILCFEHAINDSVRYIRQRIVEIGALTVV